jgi:hypothetical protein|tara:strand:+ start:126 stop:371 length:246 start_codon:yes stop_codon:yes gene_type:complete
MARQEQTTYTEDVIRVAEPLVDRVFHLPGIQSCALNYVEDSPVVSQDEFEAVEGLLHRVERDAIIELLCRMVKRNHEMVGT